MPDVRFSTVKMVSAQLRVGSSLAIQRGQRRGAAAAGRCVRQGARLVLVPGSAQMRRAHRSLRKSVHRARTVASNRQRLVARPRRSTPAGLPAGMVFPRDDVMIRSTDRNGSLFAVTPRAAVMVRDPAHLTRMYLLVDGWTDQKIGNGHPAAAASAGAPATAVGFIRLGRRDSGRNKGPA